MKLDKKEHNLKGMVSVIVNCYNGEKYLSKCINSILTQTYKNFEIIFWDNQSNDKSSEIVKSYKDKRIKYFYSKEHTNLYSARNEALKKTKGEYIAFLDVDDYWLNKNLEIQLKLFEDPAIGFVSSNFLLKLEDKKKLIYQAKTHYTSGNVLSNLLKSYKIGLLTLIIRKSFLQKLEFSFNTSLHFVGDFDLVIRLSSICKMGRANEYLSVYRIHKNNESLKDLEKQINEIELWYFEMKNNKKISNNSNFKYVYYKILYLRGMKHILNKQKSKVLHFYYQLPYSKMKIKLLIALLMPLSLLKKIKNYSAN